MQKQEILIPELGNYFLRDSSNPKDYNKFARCSAFGERLFAALVDYFFPDGREDFVLEQSNERNLNEENPGSFDSFKRWYQDPVTSEAIARFEASYVFWDKTDGTSWFVRCRMLDDEKSFFEFEFYDNERARIRFVPEKAANVPAASKIIADFFKENFVVLAE